jgi:hypothetical protein
VVASLDDFIEQGRSVLNWLGEDLQEVALIVVVNKDLQRLECLNVLLDFDARMLNALYKPLIVGIGNC